MVGGEFDPYTKHGGLIGGPAQHIAGAVCEAVNLPPKHMIDDDGDGDPYWLTSHILITIRVLMNRANPEGGGAREGPI